MSTPEVKVQNKHYFDMAIRYRLYTSNGRFVLVADLKKSIAKRYARILKRFNPTIESYETKK